MNSFIIQDASLCLLAGSCSRLAVPLLSTPVDWGGRGILAAFRLISTWRKVHMLLRIGLGSCNDTVCQYFYGWYYDINHILNKNHFLILFSNEYVRYISEEHVGDLCTTYTIYKWFNMEAGLTEMLSLTSPSCIDVKLGKRQGEGQFVSLGVSGTLQNVMQGVPASRPARSDEVCVRGFNIRHRSFIIYTAIPARRAAAAALPHLNTYPEVQLYLSHH